MPATAYGSAWLTVAAWPNPSATGALPGDCAITRNGLATRIPASSTANSAARVSAGATVASRQA